MTSRSVCRMWNTGGKMYFNNTSIFLRHATFWPTELGETPSTEKPILSIIYIQQNAATEMIKLAQVS